ncbi:MAG: hypothetical protein GX935_02685 [Erysipelotrichia bacterium]|nr:hypothetical protein [Erysipelotrichia bacterium]
MIVERIKVHKDNVKIEIANEDYKTIFKIGLDDYLSLNYRVNQKLDETEITKLEKMHLMAFSFNKCLRKLESSDRSVKEIRELLYPIKELTKEDKDKIIEKLKLSGFLSDEAVVETQFYVDSIKQIGKNKTIQTLRRRGIDIELIKKYSENVDNKEQFEMAVIKAKRILATIKDKSFQQTINILKERLIKAGFENVNEVVLALDLQKDEQNEYKSVKIAYNKALRRYKNKYSDKKLYYNIYRYLLTKGFDSSLVKEIISLESEELDYED